VGEVRPCCRQVGAQGSRACPGGKGLAGRAAGCAAGFAGRLPGRALEAEPGPVALLDRVQSARAGGELCAAMGAAARRARRRRARAEASGGRRRAGGWVMRRARGRADHPAGPEVAQRAAGARLDGQDRGLWRRQDPAHRLPDHAQGHGHVRLGRTGGAAGQALHREGALPALTLPNAYPTWTACLSSWSSACVAARRASARRRSAVLVCSTERRCAGAAQVDIYSFGVLLWELSAGEAPPGRSLRPLRCAPCPAPPPAVPSAPAGLLIGMLRRPGQG
jgi:hypothetical protein